MPSVLESVNQKNIRDLGLFFEHFNFVRINSGNRNITKRYWLIFRNFLKLKTKKPKKVFEFFEYLFCLLKVWQGTLQPEYRVFQFPIFFRAFVDGR